MWTKPTNGVHDLEPEPTLAWLPNLAHLPSLERGSWKLEPGSKNTHRKLPNSFKKVVWKQTNILGFQKQVLKNCFQNINQKLLLFLPENKGVILLVQILLVAILQDPSIKYLVQECVLMNNFCYCWSIYHVYQYIMLMINISCVIVDQCIMLVAWVLEPSLYLPCLTTNCTKHHKQTHVKSLVQAQFLNQHKLCLVIFLTVYSVTM